MENASKALIMAASVLLGVMIISVGVALFQSFGGFSKSITNEIEKNKIAEFNSQFLKYYNGDTELTAHDVVTLANLAHKTNIEQEVEENNEAYISVLLGKNQKLEKYTEDQLNDMLREDSNSIVAQVIDKKTGEIIKTLTVDDSKNYDLQQDEETKIVSQYYYIITRDRL